MQEKREQLDLRVTQAKLDQLVELVELERPDKLVLQAHQVIRARRGRPVKLATLVQVVLAVKQELPDSQE